MPEGVTPVPGLEIAGIVHAIGKNVTHFSVGDRVCALTNGGGYAEFCAVPVSQVLPAPRKRTFTILCRIARHLDYFFSDYR